MWRLAKRAVVISWTAFVLSDDYVLCIMEDWIRVVLDRILELLLDVMGMEIGRGENLRDCRMSWTAWERILDRLSKE